MRPDDTDGLGARWSALLGRVLGPVGPEVSCEECFELLDRYVERELTGADPERDAPGMRAHLQGCPACAEDYGSLRDLVAGPVRPEPGAS